MLIETVGDQIAELNDKQVKEIIASYPAEDLYGLLNYDQLKYICAQQKKERILTDVANLLKNEGCEDANYINEISNKVAEYLVVRMKFDDEFGYWTNVSNAILLAKEGDI